MEETKFNLIATQCFLLQQTYLYLKQMSPVKRIKDNNFES